MQNQTMKAVTTYPALVGNVLEQFRKEQGFNQGEVAKAVGITQTTLSRMENGQSSITVEHLKQLGDKLGIPPSQILYEAEKNALNMQMIGGVEIVKTDYDIPPLVVFLAGAALTAFVFACVKGAKA
jgi:transcriptional regulator with XRE-family HTH domain